MTAVKYILDQAYNRELKEIEWGTISVRCAKKAIAMAKEEAREELLKGAMDGRIIDDGGEIHLVVPELPIITRKMDDGDKVRVLIIPNK